MAFINGKQYLINDHLHNDPIFLQNYAHFGIVIICRLFLQTSRPLKFSCNNSYRMEGVHHAQRGNILIAILGFSGALVRT